MRLLTACVQSALLFAAGCVHHPGASGEEELAFDTQEIVNGSPDVGHPAAVALTVDGLPFCSGTLVTPTVVVTAAHCITPDIGAPSWDQVDVFFGSDVFDEGTFIEVVDGVAHEGYDVSLEDPQNDIAVLRLASPGPAVPVTMSDLPPIGTTLTLVGFGITEAGGNDGGLKRVTQATIFDEQGSVFFMEVSPSGTCSGDSGGTALWNDAGVERLVGVHTRSDCESGMLDETVGFHITNFIQPFIEQSPTCAADGACAQGCPSPDPDCPCADDGHCTNACPDVASDPDCDPACAGGGACVEDCPVADPDCTVCTADGDCNEDCASDPDCMSANGGGGSEGSGGGAGGDGDGGEESSEGCDCGTNGNKNPLRLGVFGLGLLLILKRRGNRTKQS